LQEFNTTPDADKARFFPTGDESEEFTCDRVCPPQVAQRKREPYPFAAPCRLKQ
jgi:hypothetical protein